MCGFVKRKFQYIHVCTPSKTNHFVRFKTNNNNYVTTILEKMSLLVYDRERRNSGLNKVKIVFKKLHKSCLPTNSLHDSVILNIYYLYKNGSQGYIAQAQVTLR